MNLKLLALVAVTLVGCSSHNDGEHVHAKSASEIESLKHVEIPFTDNNKYFVKAIYRAPLEPHSTQKPMRIVVIPGTPSDVEFWGEAIYRADSRAEIYAIERLGYNGSGPKRAVTSLKQHAEAIRPLVEDYEGTVIVIGQSYGASVALTALQKYSGTIDKIYLVSPYVFPVIGRKAFWLNVIRYSPLRYIGGAKTNNPVAEIVAHKRQSSSVLQIVKNTCTQVHIIHGQNDEIIEINQAHRLKELFPACANATLEIVKDGDHFLQVHSIDALIKSLNAIIQR